jgi:peptide/nickel transport system substrate-binding protein
MVHRTSRSTNRVGLWSFRRTAIATAVLATLTISACTSNKSGTTGGSVGDSLNIAMGTAPNSLDPGKIDPAFGWYVQLAYDPLIVWDAHGKAQPGLATAWKYVGSGNRLFDITLRPNVKFSDGSALTAEGVKASLEYEAKAGGQAQAYLAGKTFSVTGPLSLRITSPTPDPLIPRELTQDYMAGNIVSPTALKKPASLGTGTSGAGPYVLKASQTIAGDHYTYVPNPNYWNKDAVHYRTVTVKVIANQNSALNALKSGQVDVINGDYTTAAAAESAGLQVKYAPQVFVGINLVDRNGTLAPALRDVRVRQALNYAVDRDTITKALFGKYGTPTEQTVCPGGDGHLNGRTYSYDPQKAKQLLASAGYANGFQLPVLTTSYFGISNVDQAIASDLAKVGVQVKLTNQPNVTTYVQQIVQAKYPATGLGYGCQPIFLEGPGVFLPAAATFNPFKSSDQQLQALYTRAAGADATTQADLDRQIEQRLVDLAWFLPVSLSPVFVFARTTVSGIAPTGAQPGSDPVWWQPAGQ